MIELEGLIKGIISFGVFAGGIFILYTGFKLTNKDKKNGGNGGSSNSSSSNNSNTGGSAQ